jgi:CDP-paratose 2-epimerase
LALVEQATRWDIAPHHRYREGCRRHVVDQCLHSLFGASKVAADILIRNMVDTSASDGDNPSGCLTGPNHTVLNA